MSIVTSPPILSYVASSDNADASTDGSLRYNIFFDESLCTLGTVIMFEYMVKSHDIVIPTNTNTTYGFVSSDATISTGIQNQYVLVVPAGEQTLSGLSTEYIQFRVYVGQKSSNDIVVTDWSNRLDVHYPPETPDFTDAVAYYVPVNDNVTNDLYVFFEPLVNMYDYDQIQFIVCYYFQDENDNTVWGVSDPKFATDATIGNKTFKTVMVETIGRIHDTHNVVYVSMHAVYHWSELSNKFYSVSYVSSQLIAVASSSDSTPDITQVTYNVYNTPSYQTMTIDWTAPGNSGISIYAVDHYNLYYQLNNAGSFIQYNTVPIPSDTLTWTVDLNSLEPPMSCGTSVVYRVDAITVEYEAVEPSPDSASTNYFAYSGAVNGLAVSNTLYSDGFGSLTVNFNAPTNTGCGTPTNYVVLINGEPYNPSSGSLAYDEGAPKTIGFAELDVLPLTGSIEVYLQTTDTNSPNEQLNGASSTKPYILNNVVLSPVEYNVYNTPSAQTMSLSWTAPSLTNGWTLSGYELVASANEEPFAVIATPASNTYLYTVPSNYLIPKFQLQFEVNATVSNANAPYVMTSNVVSKNTFSYSEAVNGLTVSNTLYSNGFGSFTVAFSAPTNTGCGAPTNYVVLINGQAYSPSSGSLAYNAGAPKTLEFTDLDALPLTGSIEVYLQTTDTNSPNAQQNGASSTKPYILNNMVLSFGTYGVYAYGNDNQQMSMNWTAPSVANGWTVTKYQVSVSNDGEIFTPFADDIQTPSVIYNVDSTYLTSVNDLQFLVTAFLSNGSTTYVMDTNTVSQQTFKYASVPLEDNVWWSTNNGDSMDMYLTFKNPSSTGINNGLQYFIVDVYDNSATPNLLSSSGQVPYVNSSNAYQIYFNNIPYSASGNVYINAYVEDTNTEDNINFASYAAQAGYVTSDIPVFVNAVANSLSFSGNIVSQGPLDPKGVVTYRDGAEVNGVLAKIQMSTLDGSEHGFTISHVIEENTNVYLYTFDLVYHDFFPNGITNPSFSFAVSNTVGVGVALVDNLP
jgi:hypothetical protein